MSNNQSKIIVALDYSSSEQAMKFVGSVTPQSCKLKVGKELFTSAGPDVVKKIVDLGFDVFLDLKFHDIPNTVGKAVSAACGLGVWMLNVHALGGVAMMEAAKKAVVSSGSDKATKLIAVSILTSTNQDELNEIGISKSVSQSVSDLTKLALSCDLDGMVCSAQEAVVLRKEFGSEPILVTPGIRPSGANQDDQQRIMTPEQAIISGASYLVIGRPITQHEQPLAELERINESIFQL